MTPPSKDTPITTPATTTPDTSQEGIDMTNKSSKKERIPLISNKGALESVRHFGLETEHALKELVDNALDAGATEIHVHVFDEPKSVSIVVEDNGEGIPAGSIHEVLAFGGRIQHPKTIGRFGFGLPSAICAQTEHGEVFSRVVGGEWHRSVIDLPSLRRNPDGPQLDPAEQVPPPAHLPLRLRSAQSGTVVHMKECDRHTPKRVDKLEELFIAELGETYRYFISSDSTMRDSEAHQRVRIFVNGTEIRPEDPLMLLADHRYVDIAGMGKELVKLPPLVFEDVIDPSTGAPATVHVRVSMLDQDKINANAAPKKIKDKLRVGVKGQGFSVVRQGREIASAQTLWVLPRHNRFNYVRWEISFGPVLDDYFGIQTHKSRFHLRQELRSKLNALVEKYITVVDPWAKRSLAKEAAAEVETTGRRPSEVNAAEAEKTLRPPELPSITPEERERRRLEREAKKKGEIEKVETATNLSRREKDVRIKIIEGKYEFKGPFEVVLEANNTGHFYDIRPAGDYTELVYNTSHPFWTEIYEKAAQEGWDYYIDVLIMTLARAELMYLDNPDMTEFYHTARGDWTAILRKYLRNTAPVPAAGEGRRPEQETNDKISGEVA